MPVTERARGGTITTGGKNIRAKFVLRAIHMARKSDVKSHKHGCVIIRNGQIVAEGFNHYCDHLRHQYTIHAEVHALSRLKGSRGGGTCDMIVVRVHTDGALKLSRPCEHCQVAIYRRRGIIRRVFFSGGQSGCSSQLVFPYRL